MSTNVRSYGDCYRIIVEQWERLDHTIDTFSSSPPDIKRLDDMVFYVVANSMEDACAIGQKVGVDGNGSRVARVGKVEVFNSCWQWEL